MKGIILAGGNGTRLFPLTLSVSKQLLPVFDKPMIFYPLSTLIQAEIREILIISREKDINAFRNLLGSGSRFGCHFDYEIQDNPGGIAEAFLIAKDWLLSESVCLILGDNIFYFPEMKDWLLSARKQIEQNGGALIPGIDVPNPSDYGVVKTSEDGKIILIEEKPVNPDSKTAIPGLYFYDNRAVQFAENLKPSVRNELEITDLHKLYLNENNLTLSHLPENASWFDAGTIERLYEAGTFVKNLQEKNGIVFGSPETEAFKNGWITKRQIKKSWS